MAIQVITDGYFAWNSVDLSDHVTKFEVEYDADEVESTAMGATTHTFLGGLKKWAFNVTLNNDEAASSVIQTLFPDVGVQRTTEVRPVKTGGRTTTNPGYTGTGLLVSCPPLSVGVGELSQVQIRIVSAGALSRATA